jgi:16S rRNA A1518/A1519 N6-dimethyltransferase RsmA/KsgA/DIM1 with predicted DNA glycosylase/AP lyase activity
MPRNRETEPSGPRHRPRKRFAQHFLAPSWARRVVDTIHYQPGDVFLEIGPGHGAITLPLAATGAPILAVEVDRDLVEDLATKVPPSTSFRISPASSPSGLPTRRDPPACLVDSG